jgi:hypothetical protein
MVSRRLLILLILFTHFTLSLGAQEKATLPDAVLYFQKRLSAYRIAHPSNNLFLHLDKNIYSPEETVWFKAYLLGDTSMEAKVLYVRIIDQEKTVVAEAQFPMYDIRSHGSIELSKPSNTRVMGYRYIYEPPKILLEGSYMLYAYTDRMVSLNDTNVFVQPIRIRQATGRTLQVQATVIDTAQLKKGGDVRVKTTLRSGGSLLENVGGEYQLLAGGKELKHGRLKTNVSGEAFINFTYPQLPDDESLQLKMLFTRQSDHAELALNLPHRGNPLTVNFHPEDGTLTAGGRVSVEVLDIHGNPVSTKLLVKRGGAIMDSLHTGRQGTALWKVPTDPNMRYTVMTADGKGERELVVPPPNETAGYSLKLYSGSTGYRGLVRNSGPSGKALLLMRSLDKVVWSHPVNVKSGDSLSIDFPAINLPKGMWNLALFDHENKLQAERLFLNKQKEDYKVTIHTEQQDYGTKKKVTVRLQVVDAAGNPVIANLSVSATEKNRVDSTTFVSILHSKYYGGFATGLRNRLLSAGPGEDMDNLLLGRYWPHNQWKDILSHTGTGAPVRIPNTKGTTGLVVGMQYVGYSSGRGSAYVPAKKRIRQVQLRGVKKLTFTDDNVETGVERRTIKVDPNTQTFFVPDSLLLSKKGGEWQLEIPHTGNEWRYEYLVEWQDPAIQFDSTVLRSRQLRLPERLSSFRSSKVPGVSLFDFQGNNQLQEVVIGEKEKPVQRTLRRTNCEHYEAMFYKDISSISSSSSSSRRVGMSSMKGRTYTLGWYYSGGGKVITYLGCGRYRDINYIRNITIPEEFPLLDYELYPSLVEDTRSTVYWNPNIVTDADGTATFSFFTSEITGEFTIIAQGLNINTLIPMMGKGTFNVTAK